MSTVRIYGKKGMILAKPFTVNSADDGPEVNTEEENIINSPVSETDKTEFTEVGEQTGN